MAEQACNSGTPRRCLLLVDMSEEQMSTVKHNAKDVVANCRTLATNANNFFDLVVDCRLWLHNPAESSLSWVFPETGRSMFVPRSKGAALFRGLEGLSHLTFVPKNNYSCFANSPLLTLLRQHCITDIYICGINTDFCVFATALDAFQNMLHTYVVVDAVSSVRGKKAHEDGVANLARHFGDSSLVSTAHLTSLGGPVESEVPQ